MSEGANRKRPIFKRKSYFIDRRMQLAIVLPLIAVVGVVGLAYVVAIYLLPGEMALQTLTVEETHKLFRRANAIYYSIGAVLITSVAILLSHRIAGPARIIERALSGLLRGEAHRPVRLRPNDSLQSLAAVVNELGSQLEQREEHRAKIVREIDTRLKSQDVAGARELLSELESDERSDAPS